MQTTHAKVIALLFISLVAVACGRGSDTSSVLADDATTDSAKSTAVCSVTAQQLNLALSSISLTCPANCGNSAVWGSDIYTTDSSICSAAIHSGAIERAVGGTVTVYPTGKMAGAFEGTRRNDVDSQSYTAEWASFSLTVPGGVSAHFHALWEILFGREPDMPTIDAKSVVYWAGRLKEQGCKAADAEFIRAGVPFNPWNAEAYVDGVRGVGPHNSSYNLGYLKMVYGAVFGSDPGKEQIDWYLPMLDDGRLDAKGLADALLAVDTASDQLCSMFQFDR